MNPDSLTLDQIAKALPPANFKLLNIVAPPETHEELIEVGRQIKSSRILTDTRRIYALAFTVWEKATPDQKDALVGFSPEMLALGVDRAIALHKLTEDTGDGEQVDAETLVQRKKEAQVAFERGVSMRDHARGVLLRIAGRDAAMRARVEKAYGTMENAEALERALERLVVLGKEWLAEKSQPTAGRVLLARLDAAYLDKVAAAGTAVETTAAAALAKATTKQASQGEIDLLDGINIQILGDVVQAFEGAHDVDGTIPRLVPIATRRLLGKRHKPEQAEEAPPSEPPAPAPSEPTPAEPTPNSADTIV